MLHCSRFRALLMHGMFKNHQHTAQELQMQLNSSPQLFLLPRQVQRIISVNPSQTFYLSWHTQSQLLPTFNLEMIQKMYEKYRHTTQRLHTCTKYHQDNNRSYFPSTYITIRINPKIPDSCTPPCTISEGYLRHQISSKGDSHSTTIKSKISSQETSYRLCSSTKQLGSPNSQYIHPSRYHTNNYSNRIMITILHTSIIQSQVKNKPMILSALEIISSGKLASQMRSAD